MGGGRSRILGVEVGFWGRSRISGGRSRTRWVDFGRSRSRSRVRPGLAKATSSSTLLEAQNSVFGQEGFVGSPTKNLPRLSLRWRAPHRGGENNSFHPPGGETRAPGPPGPPPDRPRPGEKNPTIEGVLLDGIIRFGRLKSPSRAGALYTWGAGWPGDASHLFEASPSCQEPRPRKRAAGKPAKKMGGRSPPPF